MSKLQKISTFLWFDDTAEEAARFYVSLIPDSTITSVMPGPTGKALVVGFTLAGVPYSAMNGGPAHVLSEAVSIVVHCETQSEVDHFWDALTADGGQPIQCGWLKDRFGLSWQITPNVLLEGLADADPIKAARVMTAMLGMVKIDIAAIEAAYRGE
jgi:predicted 3-demethylubiquinone-9 3-methyltransferase (glyoxalase superfamily)